MERRLCRTRLLLVKCPHAVCLGIIDRLADLACQLLEQYKFVCAREEFPLPLFARFLLLFAHLTLACLDDALLGRCGVHVALVNGIGDLLPGAPCLKVVLLLNGRDGQRCSLDDVGVERVDYRSVLGLTILDLPSLGPLSFCLVDDILLFAFGVKDGGESVLLAGYPALAAVVDARSVARSRLDVGAAVQLDVRGACNEAFDVQGGECDEVVLVERVEVEDGMADLLQIFSNCFSMERALTHLDVDGRLEGRLLRIVAVQTDAMLAVPYAVSRDGWVMTAHVALASCAQTYQIMSVPDLLTDELCRACLVLPLAQEQLAQERVQGLLLAAKLLTATGVLLLEGADEPLQDEHGTLGRVLLCGGCDKYGGVFGPVRRELGERLGGENEGRRRHGREVAIEGGDRLPCSQ